MVVLGRSTGLGSLWRHERGLRILHLSRVQGKERGWRYRQRQNEFIYGERGEVGVGLLDMSEWQEALYV